MAQKVRIQNDMEQEDGTHKYVGTIDTKSFEAHVKENVCIVRGGVGDILTPNEEEKIRQEIEEVHGE